MSTSNEMCGGFFVHTMKHCYATALYTTEESAIRYTCAYKFTARVKSRILWPPHTRTFCELVEGEENKLTTFST